MNTSVTVNEFEIEFPVVDRVENAGFNAKFSDVINEDYKTAKRILDILNNDFPIKRMDILISPKDVKYVTFDRALAKEVLDILEMRLNEKYNLSMKYIEPKLTDILCGIAVCNIFNKY